MTTREQLIEAMARAICNHWKNAQYYGDQWPEVSSRLTGQADDFRAKATEVLTAIEAAGLCIVPREATWDQIDAVRLALRNTRVSPVSVMSIDGQYETEHAREFAAYRAMIEAGRL